MLADSGRQAAMSAAAEAAAAATHVTPAQRERAIAEAAAKVMVSPMLPMFCHAYGATID